MIWVARMLAGPLLWALLFAAVYALHGMGCAMGWTARDTALGSLHPLGMVILWLAGLGLHGALIAVNRGGNTPVQSQLIRSGNWVGAVSSAVTLLPVVVTSTCG